MLQSQVSNALSKLVAYVPDGKKYAIQKSTIDQATLGTSEKSQKTIHACNELLEFCKLNGIDHASQVAVLWNIARKDRDLPNGVGEFMIVRYMQMYPNLYTVADYTPYLRYLSNRFILGDSLPVTTLPTVTAPIVAPKQNIMKVIKRDPVVTPVTAPKSEYFIDYRDQYFVRYA
jgi:hypothetical protein